MERSEEDELEKIRWRDHKSKAHIMRRAIQEYIYNHAEGNDCYALDKWNEDPDYRVVPTLSSSSEKWYRFLNECSEQEMTDIMVKTTKIIAQCRNIQAQR